MKHPIEWVTASPAWEGMTQAPATDPMLLRFASDTFMQDLQQLLDSGARMKPTQNSGLGFRVVDEGSPVGIDRATGLPTSKYTIVTYGNGSLNTMYPGVPRWWPR